MSSVMCSLSGCCSPMASVSTWSPPCQTRCESTRNGFKRWLLHRFSTGFLHVSLRAGGESPATNVPSGRVHRSVVFSSPRSPELGLRGKEVGRERIGKGSVGQPCNRLRRQQP